MYGESLPFEFVFSQASWSPLRSVGIVVAFCLNGEVMKEIANPQHSISASNRSIR